MLRILAVVALAVGLLVSSASPGSAAPVLAQSDPHGDVHVRPDTTGVDPALVASVDLRHVTMTRRRDGLRVVVRMSRLVPAGRYLQDVSLTASPTRGSHGASWLLLTEVIAQHPGRAQAIFIDDVTAGEGEDPPTYCRMSVAMGEHVVRFDIPEACLAPGAGRLRVQSELIDRHSSASQSPVVATDELRVNRLVDLT